MDEPNVPDPRSWFNEWNKVNKKMPKHRLTEYLKDERMQYSENFDEFFKNGKENMSKEDWEKLVKGFSFKHMAKPKNMVIMFEGDYENLIEMRGLFKNTNRPEYVETINKILKTVNPQDSHE